MALLSQLLTLEDLGSPLQSNCKASINCPRKILPQKEFPSAVQKPKHVPFLAMLVTWQTLVSGRALQSCFTVGKQRRFFSIHSADLNTTGPHSPEKLLDGLTSDLVLLQLQFNTCRAERVAFLFLGGCFQMVKQSGVQTLKQTNKNWTKDKEKQDFKDRIWVLDYVREHQRPAALQGPGRW